MAILQSRDDDDGVDQWNGSGDRKKQQNATSFGGLGWTGLDALNFEGEGKKGLKDDSAALIQTGIDDHVHTKLEFYQVVQWKER